MTDCFICHDGKDCQYNGKCPMCGRVRPDKHSRPTKRAVGRFSRVHAVFGGLAQHGGSVANKIKLSMMNQSGIPIWLVRNVPLHLLKQAVELAEKEAVQHCVQLTRFPACKTCEYNPCDVANNSDYCPARE